MKASGPKQDVNGSVAYRWGEVLRFTEGGNALAYLGDGWARPEDGVIWTRSHNVRLSLSISAPKSEVALIISCLPFLADGKVPYQELHVFANFLRVGFSLVTEPGEIEFRIPARVFSLPELELDFYLPKACSPASLGMNEDIRYLGLAVYQIMMIEN